jgi:hypothetical protein
MLNRSLRNHAAMHAILNRRMDCRVKPGNDDAENHSRDASRARALPTTTPKRTKLQDSLPAKKQGGGAPTLCP